MKPWTYDVTLLLVLVSTFVCVTNSFLYQLGLSYSILEYHNS